MDAPRLPPGQNLIADHARWPVVGETAPRETPFPWEVAVVGRVETSRIWRLDHLMTWPQETWTVDVHCVTRWSHLGRRFTGAPLRALIERSKPDASARFVRFAARSERGHDTTLPLEIAMGCLVAFAAEGAPLAPEHGGPVRVVTPGRYFYKSLKWLERVELMAENRLGYWESGPGYHDGADPWAEERYVSGNIPPELRARMIARRAIGRRSLLGVDFSGAALAGLDAAGATLRNCAFRGADLRGADFSRANLSNADLAGADLRAARFAEADVEGAAFDGADLRGADFAGASLFGASFVSARGAARVEGASGLGAAAARLADDQAAWLEAALAGGRAADA